MQETAEQIEKSKEEIEDAKAQITHSKEQIKRTIELNKGQIELEPDKTQLERAKEQIKCVQGTLDPPRNRCSLLSRRLEKNTRSLRNQTKIEKKEKTHVRNPRSY